MGLVYIIACVTKPSDYGKTLNASHPSHVTLCIIFIAQTIRFEPFCYNYIDIHGQTGMRLQASATDGIEYSYRFI